MKLLRRTLISVLFIAGALAGFRSPLEAQQIRVITTIPDLADITKQIGKEWVNVESLTRGVEFMHAVPVKPSFVPRLNRANILVEMGMDLEASWLPALLEVANNSRILPGQPGNIDCSAGITVLEVPRTVDRSEGDVHPKGNPHYNVDPLNGRFIARNIAEGLSRNYPQHRSAFEKNLGAYLAELDKAIARWQTMAAPLKGVKIVTYHQVGVIFPIASGSNRSV
jgi:ABC-type Zn uptake system ZnuABC Zn-binding protein ZnuA